MSAMLKLARNDQGEPEIFRSIQGEGPALWVIKDADSTLYLFGSVHVLRPTTGWASPRVNAAFDSATDVWFEITNPEDQAAMMPLIQQYGLSPQTPLSSRLTPEELARQNRKIGVEIQDATIRLSL